MTDTWLVVLKNQPSRNWQNIGTKEMHQTQHFLNWI